MITPQEIILYKDVSCSTELLGQINIIASHTQNTCQKNRTLTDIIKDTTIGKIAEHTLKEHIAAHSDFAILDYDDFRVNNYKKHAPLDCILFKKENTNLQAAKDAINTDATNNQSGAMSKNTKALLKTLDILTLEIKSTRITERHKKNNVVDCRVILNDDFLAYPFFYRKIPADIQINSWEQYREYCIKNKRIQPDIEIDALQEFELENMYDCYARVYVEQKDNNLFDIYIIGYISKRNFIANSVIKRMPQRGKSEQALYIATAIKNGSRFKN